MICSFYKIILTPFMGNFRCQTNPFSFRKLITILGVVLILGCSISPTRQDNPPKTWQEFDVKFKALAENVSILAADISDGNCTAVHAIDPNRTLAVGSSFKLYVLAELAQQIATQNNQIENIPDNRELPLSWDTLLPVRQSNKSIPHGALLFVPDDTQYTVRYFAEQMIQRSDNTATDHLVFLLGRENIEQRLALSGHHNPVLNTPLMATREFAVMKFLYSENELSEYLTASTEKKRAILNNEKRGYKQIEHYFENSGEQILPVRINSVEWFANRFDMCHVLMSLYDKAKEKNMKPVIEILSLEDQLDIDRQQWTYVGFKGGSELGVLAGNWLLQRNDGRLFVLTIALNNTGGAIDISSVVPVLQSAVNLLYQTPVSSKQVKTEYREVTR